jgi:hypothetical protein
VTEVQPTISVSCDNPQDWAQIVDDAHRSGQFVDVTPATISAIVAGGVPAMFHAAATGELEGLRSIFTSSALGNISRAAPMLAGTVPQNAVIHLVGLVPGPGGDPVIRIHLSMHALDPQGQPEVIQQFWDISQTGTVVVNTRPTCPGCGAPVPAGTIRCPYCGVDVRETTAVPVIVSRVQMY